MAGNGYPVVAELGHVNGWAELGLVNGWAELGLINGWE